MIINNNDDNNDSKYNIRNHANSNNKYNKDNNSNKIQQQIRKEHIELEWILDCSNHCKELQKHSGKKEK